MTSTFLIVFSNRSSGSCSSSPATVSPSEEEKCHERDGSGNFGNPAFLNEQRHWTRVWKHLPLEPLTCYVTKASVVFNAVISQGRNMGDEGDPYAAFLATLWLRPSSVSRTFHRNVAKVRDDRYVSWVKAREATPVRSRAGSRHEKKENDINRPVKYRAVGFITARSTFQRLGPCQESPTAISSAIWILL